MKYRKMALVAVVIIALTAIFAGCANAPMEGPQISVNVVITAEEELLKEDVLVNEESTADKAILIACQSKKLAYTLKDGMFDYFGAIASTQTDGWLFYVNGTLADVGAAQYKLQDGDVVEFIYQNYDEAFTLF